METCWCLALSWLFSCHHPSHLCLLCPTWAATFFVKSLGPKELGFCVQHVSLVASYMTFRPPGREGVSLSPLCVKGNRKGEVTYLVLHRWEVAFERESACPRRPPATAQGGFLHTRLPVPLGSLMEISEISYCPAPRPRPLPRPCCPRAPLRPALRGRLFPVTGPRWPRRSCRPAPASTLTLFSFR